jgi:hypothetical protein
MFGVQGAESFQAEYQKLIDTWMRRFTEIENSLAQNKSKLNQEKDKEIEKESLGRGDITISDSEGNILYEKGKTYDITPKQIQKIDEASQLSPSDKLEGLPSLNVEVDGETFFQSENEEVLVNRKQPESDVQNRLQGDVKVYLVEDGESELIYGQVGQRTIDKLTPEQLNSLSSPDTQAGGLAGLKVKAGEEVIFQADESGNFLINQPEKLTPALAQIQQLKQEGSRQVQPDWVGGDYPNYVDNYSFNSPEISDPTADILVELMAPIIEAMPTVEPEREQQPEPSLMDFLEPESDSQRLEVSKELSSTAPYVPEAEQQDGLSALQSALGEMKPATLKDVLQGMTTDMEATAREQEPNPDMEALVKSRLEERQNPHWWDKVSAKVETMVSRVRDTFTQHRAASTLKDFAAGMGLQSGESYQGASYNISRQGKDYTLTDKQGNELMKFQSSPLGVKVDKSLPALDSSHFQKTEQLRQDLKETRQPSGAFISEGAAEGQNLQRINALTQALSQYAAKNGGVALVEGKFSYDWQANGTGSVIIQDKQGSVLLATGQGHTRSRMSEKDLQHFEQMLPALASQQSRPPQAQVAVASKGKLGLER